MSHRHRRHRLRRLPPGAPPGALLGAADAHPASLHRIAYDADRLVEHEGKSLGDLDRHPVKPTKVWIDVQGLADLDLIRALGERYGLHPLAIADVVHVDQRPKVDSYGEHLFIVLRLPHREDGLSTEQLSIVLGKGFVLTFQERPGDCFQPVRERLRRAGSQIRSRGVDYLAYALIDALIDAYFPILEQVGEQIEDLEQRVILNPDPGRVAEIQKQRHELLELRRAVWPQRDVVSLLVREDTPCIEEGTRVFLRDCLDHAFQLVDMVELHREATSYLFDLHLTMLGVGTNEIMKLLTIIATIFIPLGFIAGLYGMNFDPEVSPYNMPELGWRFGYPMALGLMAAVVLGLLGYFYRKGWIGGRTAAIVERSHRIDGADGPSE